MLGIRNLRKLVSCVISKNQESVVGWELVRRMWFSSVLGTCKVKWIYSYNSLRSRNACGE